MQWKRKLSSHLKFVLSCSAESVLDKFPRKVSRISWLDEQIIFLVTIACKTVSINSGKRWTRNSCETDSINLADEALPFHQLPLSNKSHGEGFVGADGGVVRSYSFDCSLEIGKKLEKCLHVRILVVQVSSTVKIITKHMW